MRLSEKELHLRQAVVGKIRQAASSMDPDSRVTTYGSITCGTATQASCVDVWVKFASLEKEAISTMLAAAGCSPVNDILCTELGGFVQVKHKTGTLKYNLTLALDDSTPLASNSVTQEWAACHPQAVTAHAAIREVLDQTSNLDVCSGGISSYALFAMIVAVCKISSHTTPHALLVEVCRWYGTVFDFTALGVSTSTGWCAKPVGCQDTLFVEDPLDKTNNLAAGCSRLFAIKVQFQHCFKTLQRWQVADGEASTYKGRTPLSGIISHKRLWPRAEKQDDSEAGTSESEEDIDEGSEVLSVRAPASFRGAKSLTQIFAVTSYDSLCSLDDSAELGEMEDALLCDVERTALAFH
eukprot:TRINITY_DN1051_c0_g1_i1.p1 TRINITY_DN1051_c0_g1~~TRINITY_DN1051_c0_g1_i1.p1  ORF type:complete len:353 (+),score=106.69 TRINITY_DN1051_c0_g1_i1:264-1322(+)